jgi:protein arginine kinase activator
MTSPGGISLSRAASTIRYVRVFRTTFRGRCNFADTMLCNICQEKEATVHLTKVEGDKMHKVDLCEACSKEKNVNAPSGGSISSIFKGLTDGVDLELDAVEPIAAENCPACDFTQADFKKTGRFGCPECYEAFAGNLDALLRTMHRDVRHVGKTPGSHKNQAAAEKLKTLEKRLEDAIAKEEFEKAAALRDEIGSLSKSLKKSKSKQA